MVELAIADHPAFVVNDLELNRTGPSYTIDTVHALQKAYPGTRFALLLGGDSLADFPRWYRPEEIVQRVPLLVYQRPGINLPDLPDWLAQRVHVVDAPLIGLSSTDIRQRCREGRSIRYRVRDAVRTYIETHHLYREAPHG